MKRTIDPRATWSSPNPTASVIESRVPVFAPILRGSHNSLPRMGRYKTQWGWVELKGPILTQEHRAILDMAMAMAVKKQVFRETGGMAVWFDAWKVKKALGPKYSGGEGHKRFIERIREMRRAELRVHSNMTGRTRESGIIDMHTYDESHPDNPERQGIKTTWRGHCLYEIRLSPNFMQFFKDELRVHYDPLVPEIVRIQDGTIRAIILFFLTHKKNCHYGIRKVMKIVGAISEGQSGDRMNREVMAKPKKFKAELGNFGIFVEGEILRYERHPKVLFTNPPTTLEGASEEERNPESPEN
ncbi:MAG: hypothetical protein VST70_05250 [Nitrospirota bacterium]|nr:hypothetical protein [Nitrospirota bacterium]